MPSHLPDLSGLRKDLLTQRYLQQLVMIAATGGIGGYSAVPDLRRYAAQQLGDAFVRTVDTAIVEYELARADVALFDGTLMSPYFGASSHFDACVVALWRAVRYLNHMHRREFLDPDGQPLVPSGHVLVGTQPWAAAAQKIKDFRDVVEHMEERIVEEAFEMGDAVYIEVKPSGIVIDDRDRVQHELRYEELAGWLSALHAIAARISEGKILIQRPAGG